LLSSKEGTRLVPDWKVLNLIIYFCHTEDSQLLAEPFATGVIS